jgi:hypothetical protein
MAVRDVTKTGGYSRPPVGPDVVERFADEHAVCSRPIVRRVTDRATGVAVPVVIPCGSTQESVCEACAARARRLRMQQCSEGWHMADDPLDDALDDAVDEANEPDGRDQAGEDSEDCDAGDAVDEGAVAASRRVRSTRRRADAPDLPRVPMAARSVGRTFTPRPGRSTGPRCSSR